MYPVLTLNRSYNNECTNGRLRLPSGAELCTLERPWRNNLRNVSCIEAGAYLCTWLERSGSGKYKQVWHIKNVHERSGVLIHNGNLVRHTLGCILVGTHHGRLYGQQAVLGSRTGLNLMRDELEGKDFIILIR